MQSYVDLILIWKHIHILQWKNASVFIHLIISNYVFPLLDSFSHYCSCLAWKIQQNL